MNSGTLERKYYENFHNKCYCLFTKFTFKLNSTNTEKEGIHDLWNRNMIKISITNLIVFEQFTFKLNSMNTVKEGIHEFWNRNMMNIFITNVIVFTEFTFKLNSINTVKEGINELEQKYDENFHIKCYCLYTI